jgi:protease-4
METQPPNAGYAYGVPPPSAPPAAPVILMQPAAAPAPRKGGAWPVIKVLFLIGLIGGLGVSLLFNFAFFLQLAGGENEEDRIAEQNVPDYAPKGRDKIALIEIEGLLDASAVRTWGLMVDKARRDERVKALVLAVNSPGGEMTAIDDLYVRLQKLHEARKPIVVAMGGMAASGGYYIAMPADEIFAQPTTITGSIGVLMPHYNIAGFLKDHNVKDETFVASGSKNKNAISWTKETTPEGKAMVQGILDDAYERFISVVVKGRPRLAEAAIRVLADGSIYTARQAQASGLIDTIGYLEDAVAKAQALASLTEFRLVRYVRPFSWRSLLSLSARQPTVTIDPNQVFAPRGPQVQYLCTGWEQVLGPPLPLEKGLRNPRCDAP